MITTVSIGTSILFVLLALIMIIWYYRISQSKTFLMVMIAWVVLTSILAYTGFFRDYAAFPPKIGFGIIPTFLASIFLFFSEKGRAFMDSFDLEQVTLANTIRIPVELGLAWLAHQGAVSVWQTFAGANFDIFSGLTAILVWYLFFKTKRLPKIGMLIWNIGALILLLTIVTISTLAAPFPFQQLAFEQPNIAIFYFPFNLLPMLIVPLVLLGHLVSIRQLLRRK